MKFSNSSGEEDEVFKISSTKVWQFHRRREPQHFLLKVESFSVLSESSIQKYESSEFEAGGYKWRLILYPKGDEKRNGSSHISLYLSVSDTENLPPGWEVEAHFSLFVYNKISDEYLTCQVSSPRRFHWLKTELGFAQLLELDYFKDTSNGYLFDDACVFGAEVSVISAVAKRESLSMKKETNNKIFTWKLDNFSAIREKCIYSDKFEAGELQWKLIVLHPIGKGDGKGRSISLFLRIVEDGLTRLAANWKVYAEYKLIIRNQLNSDHVVMQANHWFSKSSTGWGCNSFMLLSDLNDKSKGFVVNDTLLVEAEITIAAMTKNIK